MRILPKKWATVTGSVGSMLAGLALFCKMLASEDGFDYETTLEALALFNLGLMGFGIGRKIERQG